MGSFCVDLHASRSCVVKGYQIHNALSGSMHDHSLNFKVDLDILGTKNSLAAHTIKPCDVKYDWNNYTRSTMKIEKGYISNENDAQIVSSRGEVVLDLMEADGLCRTGEPTDRRSTTSSTRTRRTSSAKSLATA